MTRSRSKCAGLTSPSRRAAAGTFGRLWREDKALAPHADQPGDESVPAGMELRPAHAAPIGEMNVIGIEAVSNHPMPVGHIKKLQKASARNTEHDDDGPLPGQLLAQRLFT